MTSDSFDAPGKADDGRESARWRFGRLELLLLAEICAQISVSVNFRANAYCRPLCSSARTREVFAKMLKTINQECRS